MSSESKVRRTEQHKPLHERVHEDLLGHSEPTSSEPATTRRQRSAGPVHAEDGGPITDDALTQAVRRVDPLADAATISSTVRRVRARMTGIGAIEGLLADPGVTDVLINGPGPVWIERLGRLEQTSISLTSSDISLLIEKSLGPLGLRADRVAPVVDARLADGSRLHVVLPPLAIDGPYVTIRRFDAKGIPLDAFCSDEVGDLLVSALAAGMNIVVSGGTGAGKTTLLNALCGHLPPQERVVTIEDSAELRLPGDHVVRLETRPETPDGVPAQSIRDLVRAALRMRPDRLVVGEVRGAEAFDMLQALNTGHDGGLSSCHANSPADGLRRLETLAGLADIALRLEAIREQLAAAIDLIVQVVRLPDGSRRISTVAEVATNPLATRRVKVVARDDTVVGKLRRPPRRSLLRHLAPAGLEPKEERLRP